MSTRGSGQRALNPRVPAAHARSPSLGGAQTPGSASAPPGVCRAFWADGECKFGFQCRYKHERSPRHASAAPTPTMRTQGTTTSSAEIITPLLNVGGLAKLTERSTDSFFFADPSRQLAPSEVHNHLKRYLFDNYRFRHVLDMYSFLKLISNASTNNTQWVSVLILYIAHDILINLILVARRWPGRHSSWNFGLSMCVRL